jgi:hypothetical protein
MIKQTWNISSSEKERILRLHESATQNQYLIKEQETEQPETDIQGKVKIVEDEFTFNFNFKSGHWSVNAESSAEDGTTIVDQVAGVITNLKNFLSQYLYPQITKINIVSGESAVTNYDREIEGKNVELPKGELAKRRNETLKKLFQTYLNDLINAGLIQKLPEFAEEVVQGTETEKGEAANLEQFVKVTISVRGVKKQVGCKLNVDIVVQYDKVAETDPKFHRCNNATFQLLLNGIPVGEEGNPDSEFSLNNWPHGNSVKKNLKINPILAERILGTMKNPNDENEPIKMVLVCRDTGNCHDSPMLMTIFNKQGQVVGGPSYFGTSDKYENRMTSSDKREIGTINKCGKILTIKEWFSNPKKEIENAATQQNNDANKK